VAVRSYDRPLPAEPGFAARVGRALAYVLLVVTCTVIAAVGGYQVGARTGPSEATVAAEQDHSRSAITKAVARQKAADRVRRREALAQAMAWQRERFEAEMSTRIAEVRVAEGKNAARAFRRGKAAGAAAAATAAETEAAKGAPADDDDEADPGR
jgi:hypothetical protein